MANIFSLIAKHLQDFGKFLKNLFDLTTVLPNIRNIFAFYDGITVLGLSLALAVTIVIAFIFVDILRDIL